MIPCSECRDYNIEKVLRCEKCCIEITGTFVGGCSPTCLREEETTKVSALCTICSSHLRKEARCCKNSKELAKCKKIIRNKTIVFVQSPNIINNPTPKDRPCSHYTLCQYCKNAIVKGHRSSTACKTCRLQVVEGTLVPSKKRNRVQFCLDTGLNQYIPPDKKFCHKHIDDGDSSPNNDKPNTKSESTESKSSSSRFGECSRIPVSALLG